MEEFKVLSDRDHVLLRTQMYLGATVPETYSDTINFKYQEKRVIPALVKMYDEIVNNSIDEHVRTNLEFATKISVNVVQSLDGIEISVEDNGRGIPTNAIDGIPRPVLAWTKLRAGSNFDDSKRITAGTNGVGGACVAIMSTEFIGITCDGENKLVLSCKNNMQDIDWHLSKSTKRGTTVKFSPDMTRLGGVFSEDHIDVFKDRLVNYAIAYPTIQFMFNGEKIHFKNAKAIAKEFHEDSLVVSSDDYISIISPAGSDEEFRFISYMNGTRNKNGGSHIDFIMNRIVETVRSHVKKKHKIEVLPNQIKQHLFVGIWGRNFNSLKFDSQTKERITNTASEVAEYFKDVDWEKIAKQILNTPSIIDPMISAILFKKEREEAALLAKQSKQARKLRVVNHIAATGKNIEDRMLLLAEGLSAIGQLVECRKSSEKIGGYPLKGKIMNVSGMKPVDIMKNKEIAELLSIIGLEFGKPAIDLNYGKIVFMVDQDVDGNGHICSLLLNLFSNWPELFTAGRIYQLVTPLYICKKGKEVKRFYSKEEFDKADLKGYTIEYMKGLGSLSKEEYSLAINEPTLMQFKNSDSFESLTMAFAGSADDRKKWMML